MVAINPYLNFSGSTEEAFSFYKSLFGGEFVGGIRRFRDTPVAANLTEEELDKVMHVALTIGNGNMLMGTDILTSMDQTLTPGDNFLPQHQYR
jgi:PhnB protein